MIFNQNLNNKNSQIFPLKTVRKIYNSEFTSIPRLAFTQCARLESAYFPNVTEIGSDAFWYCRNIHEFSGPEVAVINDFGLQDCRNLPYVNFPKCSYLGICGLQNAYKLSEINIPSCEYIGNRAFQNCVTLSSIDLPNIPSVPSSAFQSCFSLSSITLSACSSIDVNAFSHCTSLLTMNLKNVASVPALADTSVFNYSPITGYFAQIAAYGSIYVPSSLYDAFISAEYWSNISARITSASVPSEPFYHTGVVGELARVWDYNNHDFTQSEFINNVDYPSPDAANTAHRGATSLPLIVDSSLATHLTFRVTTNSSFYLGFFGYTTVSFPGPHVYISTAFPADPTSVGTLLYKSPSDMSGAGGFTARVGIDSGNYGNFVTFVTSGFGSVNTWIRNRAEIGSSSVYLIGTYEGAATSSTSSSISFAMRFAKTWHDNGTTISPLSTDDYWYIPGGNKSGSTPITNLTYEIITNEAFPLAFYGRTHFMGDGPQLFISNTLPTDIDYLGTKIFEHADNGLEETSFSSTVTISSGNLGKFLTAHVWIEDYTTDFYTVCDLSPVYEEAYEGVQYLVRL